MKVSRSDAGVVLRFDRPEAELLVELLSDTAEAMRPGGLDGNDPVERRLFPSAYRGDAEAEHAFRELTESALREERVERADRCTAELAVAPTRRRGLELVLDEDGADRWMRALNDVRLALGTRLEITEDDERSPAPTDPDAGSRIAYAWLTAVQDALVHALTG